jgi:SAM-dependent methyltransferase
MTGSSPAVPPNLAPEVPSECPACGGRLRPWRGAVQVCHTCGTSARPAVPAIADRDAHYADYHDAVPELSPLTVQRLTAWATELVGSRRTGRLLEVGCGAGHFLRAASTAGFEASGTEVSASALAHLRKEGFQVFEGDLPSLRLPEASFDAVVLFEVIEHLPDPLVYLAEARRLLRVGGVLLLTTPNFDSLSRRLLSERWRVLDPEHLVLFTTDGLRRAFGRVGLQVSRIESRNVDPLEIVRGLRGREGYGSERQGRVDACRAAVATRPWLRSLKSGINGGLRLLRMGDTLEVWASR